MKKDIETAPSTLEEYQSATASLTKKTYDHIISLAQRYCVSQGMNTRENGKELDQGRKILENINDCAKYLHYYGGVHKTKITQTVTKIPSSIFNNEIDIVDWGCGQGLSTILLAEHIDAELRNNIKTVILIDPSKIALQRAEIYIKQFLPNASIRTYNCYFDKLDATCFSDCMSSTRVNLFANIIDLETVDIEVLSKIILQHSVKEEYYVCVSPAYRKDSNNCFIIRTCKHDCRLTKFFEYLDCFIIYDYCNPRETFFTNINKGVNIKIGHKGKLSLEELQYDEYKDFHSKNPVAGYTFAHLGVDVWPEFKKGTRTSGGNFYRIQLMFCGDKIEAKSDEHLQSEDLRNCVLLQYSPFGGHTSNYYRIVRRIQTKKIKSDV